MAQLVVDCGLDQMLQNFRCNCSTLPHGKTHMSFFTSKTYKRNSCDMLGVKNLNFAYRSSKSMDDIYYTRTDMNFINEKWQYWWNGQHGGSEEMYHHPAEIINMDEIDQMMKFLHKLHIKRKMTIIQMIWFSSTWLTTSTLNLDFIHEPVFRVTRMGFKVYTS